MGEDGEGEERIRSEEYRSGDDERDGGSSVQLVETENMVVVKRSRRYINKAQFSGQVP
jgi:hypothetical protein